MLTTSKGALSNSVQLPYLRELHIGGLAPPEFLQISKVLTFCSRLKEVVLSAARDDSTLTYTPAQQTLKLKGREFTDHHAHALATHFTGSNPGPSNLFPALSEIEWSGSVELTDVGLMWLVALKGLQRLEVQGCGISHQVFGARPWCDNSKSRLLLTGGDMLYQVRMLLRRYHGGGGGCVRAAAARGSEVRHHPPGDLMRGLVL